jgi:hypothetical protein
MSHLYTLKRCATLPTNFRDLIAHVTLPPCYQVSLGHAELYQIPQSTLCIEPDQRPLFNRHLVV